MGPSPIGGASIVSLVEPGGNRFGSRTRPFESRERDDRPTGFQLSGPPAARS